MLNFLAFSAAGLLRISREQGFEGLGCQVLWIALEAHDAFGINQDRMRDALYLLNYHKLSYYRFIY